MILPYNKNKLWFAVVGTGRCGTVHFAKLLSSIGLPCGHERIFGPEGLEEALKFKFKNSDVAKNSGLSNRGNFFVAESSYMAVPFLDHSLLNEATIIHAVRNPIKVVLSFHNKLQYWHTNNFNKWESFIARHTDLGNGNALDKCCRYIIQWNRKIEAAPKRKYLRVQLETGTDNLLSFLKCNKHIELSPSNTFEEWENRKAPLPTPATPEDVLNSRYGKDIEKLMKDYDYEI